MIETAHNLIKRVGKHLGLSDRDVQYLLKTDAEHEFEISLSNGNKHKAYRVQHNNVLGPYKGGIRFHPQVDLEEIRALATLMSLKTAAIGLPFGGGKGGVAVNPKELTEADLEELARLYAAHLTPHIGPDKDIPAPDVNTNPTIIDWMVDEYEKQTGDRSKAAFTGKSIKNGGSHGRDAATGRGGVIVLREILKLMKLDRKELTYGVQGFGNVGSFFAEVAELDQPKWLLTAVTDSRGGIADAFGLSAKELDKFKSQGHKLVDYKSDSAVKISNDDFIHEEVDILVLAALGDAVNKDNMKDVKAQIVLELANGPVSEEAYDYLAKREVVVIPDVLANAGGVIVSYLEWRQNIEGERWEETKVNDEMERLLVKAVHEAYAYATKHKLSLKEAAFAIAIRRILDKRGGVNG